jgi:putative redox protein
MNPNEGTLTLKTVAGDGLRFEAEFPSGRIILDSGNAALAPNPVQQLLASVAACQAMDVISLMRKKRQNVTAYQVHMSGERATEHPRRFLSMTVVHKLTGHHLSPGAIEDSLRLTVEKYCSVYHCIRPDLPITTLYELTEA